MLVACGSAWLIEQRLTEHILELTVLRATDQVELGIIGHVSAADFRVPFPPDRYEQLASRLDVYLGRVIRSGRGVLRMHLFGPDGTVIYSDVVAKRGQVQPRTPGSLFADAFAGKTGARRTSLSSPEDADLKAAYNSALEVYVPIRIRGEVVGVYQLYIDLAPIQPIRPLVWGSVLGAFGVLFLSLFLIIRGAASLIRRHQAERELMMRRNEDRLQSLVGNTADVIAVLDATGSMSYVTPSVERAWGAAPATVQGVAMVELSHPEDRSAAMMLLEQVAREPGANVSSELRIRHQQQATAHGPNLEDSWRDFEVIARNLLADPAVNGIVVTFHDITQRKAFEQDLQRLAFHDTLSGLPNRVLFHDRLERALVRAERRRRLIAVMFLDLDNFKVVNDSLGHDVGDRLLVEAAERVQTCLRAEDTAARLGGDELAVLLEDVIDESSVVDVATRISEAMSEPMMIDGRTLIVTVSIGIALSTAARERPDTLLRNADLAMYRAKADGKARVQLFDPSMSNGALDRLELESDLRSALAGDELRVVHQPIVALSTGRIIGIEALIRWDHPSRGTISPAQFIPIAEETGLIVEIGLWVLREACTRARMWHLARPQEPPLTMSVNLSARQFLQPDLVERVADVLFETGLDPAALKLEITETVLMRDIDSTVEKLWALKRLGVKLAIDDFGTGYSSLSYLKRFPVDTLKIDRSFVSGLGEDANDTAIVRSVVALAKSLNLAVTGEGIETTAQLGHLQSLGCDRGQGYLFSKPVDAAAMGQLLSESTADLDSEAEADEDAA
ncbi:MAG: putative bifunctional diguanylate cyclase/phosphodiesterase [Chloroflexota bacterium]